MANAPHIPRGIDLRNVDPTQAKPENMAPQMARQQRADYARSGIGASDAGIITATYVGPNGEGRHFVQSPNDPSAVVEIPSNGGLDGFRPGQGVLVAMSVSGWTIIGNPVSGELSKDTSTPLVATGIVDLYGISTAAPSELEPGDSDPVTLTGFGFNETPVDTFTAVIWNSTSQSYDVDPEVTLSGVTWVSATEVTLTVTVSSSASPGRWINIQVERS